MMLINRHKSASKFPKNTVREIAFLVRLLIQMKILNIHKKGRVVFIFILSAIVLLELYFLIFLRQKVLIGNIASETDLQKYARQVQDKCKGSNYKASCYDREIPKLMDYISMEDAFNVTKIIQKTDVQYKYCHQSTALLS